MSAALQVLAVCTHNRTRSVLIGALLAEHLEAVGVAANVQSAGTAARGQLTMERAARLLADRGIDVIEHRSRMLEPEVVLAADLIVTAEQQHVVTIAGRWPGLFRCTFTLPELVCRAEAIGPRDGRPIAEWLLDVGHGRLTAFDYLDSTSIPEVSDPTGQSPAVWDQSFARIDALTKRLALVLV
jgi:protein-tyrosine-phosphatase